MRIQKDIKSGVMRIPKDLKREIGNNIILHPNKRTAVIYGENEEPEAIVRSLKVIIMDLEQDIIPEGNHTTIEKGPSK